MAKVKIYLKEGETTEQVEESLIKAANYVNSGEVHKEAFEDVAMEATSQLMITEFNKIYSEMLQEINQELDKEYDKKW